MRPLRGVCGGRGTVTCMSGVSLADVSMLVSDATPSLLLASMQDVRDALAPTAQFLVVAQYAAIPAVLGVSANAVYQRSAPLAESLRAVPQAQWAKLPLCLLLDVAGDAIPCTALLAVVFGPIDFFLLMLLFPGSGAVVPFIGLAEEWIPLTRGLPTATIAWLLEIFFEKSKAAKVCCLDETCRLRKK
ncbi:hypothetical protein M885DRAFT_623175 [Pelagophyceae sp. CCMP2097]|nr:hypothetical protein M885DRAFT_623175 [Pelagophyceae sp. CCMP2097]